jgi:RNA polymerase sigma-70 factor, ECF subfamily
MGFPAFVGSRHAASRYLAAATRRRQRNVPFAQAAAISKLAADVKSTTLPHLRTEMKSTMRRLREQLPAEEQELIILRIDKQMSWQDMAIVIDGEGLLADTEALKRTAARLRKRFQLAKDKLHALAQEAGLLDPDGGRES